MATLADRGRRRAYLSTLLLALAVGLASPSGAAPAGPRGSPPKSRIASRPALAIRSARHPWGRQAAVSLPKSALSAVPPAGRAPASAAVAAAAQEGLRRFVSALSADGRSDSGFFSLREGFDRARGQGESSAGGGSIVNGEGVRIIGRSPDYYRYIQGIVEKYRGHIDLSDSLDVMADTYSEVRAKIRGIEAVAESLGAGREGTRLRVDQHNAHLDGTLLWVDGVIRDGRRTIAAHTTQVFFHHADNPRSEIEEGIRRVDHAVREAVDYFAPGGLAESPRGLDAKLDEVVLVFDTRGYEEIKRHLRQKEREVAAAGGGRYRFAFLDELVGGPRRTAEEIREEVNEITRRYAGEELGKIIEGVIYSRYVGVGLELATVDYFMGRNHRFLQSGREVFDEDGRYVTELDAVFRDPQGRVALVEAKSARVHLPKEKVLRDKILYKLETYKKKRELIEKAIGSKIDRVIFSLDVGPLKGRLAKRNARLRAFLREQEGRLGREYGFPVEFLFLESGPKPFRGRSGRSR